MLVVHVGRCHLTQSADDDISSWTLGRSDASSNSIRTRVLLLSDTQGARPAKLSTDAERKRHRGGFLDPLPPVDVVIHSGNLTANSLHSELQATFDMLREIDADTKIAIVGHREASLDQAFWETQVGLGQSIISSSTLTTDPPATFC